MQTIVYISVQSSAGENIIKFTRPPPTGDWTSYQQQLPGGKIQNKFQNFKTVLKAVHSNRLRVLHLINSNEFMFVFIMPYHVI